MVIIDWPPFNAHPVVFLAKQSSRVCAFDLGLRVGMVRKKRKKEKKKQKKKKKKKSNGSCTCRRDKIVVGVSRVNKGKDSKFFSMINNK